MLPISRGLIRKAVKAGFRKPQPPRLPTKGSPGQIAEFPGKVPPTELLTEPTTEPSTSLTQRLRRIGSILVLTLPIVAGAVYFYGIGRPRYPSEANVVIRKAEDSSQAITEGALGLLLGGNNQSSTEDAKFLTVFLSSPQMQEVVEKQLDFRQRYRKQGLDFYAGLANGASQEDGLAFYQKQISVFPNEATGTLVIRSSGYDSDSSYRLNRILLQKAERFVNDISQQISLKQKEFAEKELASAKQKLERSKLNLLTYQKKNQQLNPVQEAEVTNQMISTLESKLVDLRIELAAKERQFKEKDAPEVVYVRDQVQSIQSQITQERKRSVGKEGRDLSKKSAEFLALEGDVKYREDLYKLAISAVEKARVEANRQQKFLVLLSSPRQAQDQDNSWRTRGFLSLVAIWLGGYALTKFMLGMASNRYE
jgi:capsular polysaccharide transport system permease protein